MPETFEFDSQRSAPARVPKAGEVGMAARTLVEERLRSVRRAIGRDVAPVDVVVEPTSPESRQYLFEEACELYWNELAWEELTDEERLADGAFTEMVFPGLLAFLDALLPRAGEGEPDRSREHRDVAHDFLLWLAGRLVELRNASGEGPEGERRRREAALTDDLVDLVTHRLYCLSPAEIEGLRRY